MVPEYSERAKKWAKNPVFGHLTKFHICYHYRIAFFAWITNVLSIFKFSQYLGVILTPKNHPKIILNSKKIILDSKNHQKWAKNPVFRYLTKFHIWYHYRIAFFAYITNVLFIFEFSQYLGVILTPKNHLKQWKSS